MVNNILLWCSCGGHEGFKEHSILRKCAHYTFSQLNKGPNLISTGASTQNAHHNPVLDTSRREISLVGRGPQEKELKKFGNLFCFLAVTTVSSDTLSHSGAFYEKCHGSWQEPIVEKSCRVKDGCWYWGGGNKEEKTVACSQTGCCLQTFSECPCSYLEFSKTSSFGPIKFRLLHQRPIHS